MRCEVGGSDGGLNCWLLTRLTNDDCGESAELVAKFIFDCFHGVSFAKLH